MQLVIPMKTSETWLMHPVTDLLRFHYAGRIPNGKGKLWDYGGKLRDVRYTDSGEPDANGKVWDSRHVGRWQLPGPFVPYIWLGGPERGICWFAENDRDWSLDPEQPTLEIRRQGETHFACRAAGHRPVVLSAPRHDGTFGLMATPAKPMPETPVSFRRWWPGLPSEKTANVVDGLHGGVLLLGRRGPASPSIRPSRTSASTTSSSRLRERRPGGPGFTDKWLAQFGGPRVRAAPEDVSRPRQLVGQLLCRRPWRPRPGAGQTAYVIPYTNARAINWGDGGPHVHG